MLALHSRLRCYLLSHCSISTVIFNIHGSGCWTLVGIAAAPTHGASLIRSKFSPAFAYLLRKEILLHLKLLACRRNGLHPSCCIVTPIAIFWPCYHFSTILMPELAGGLPLGVAGVSEEMATGCW